MTRIDLKDIDFNEPDCYEASGSLSDPEQSFYQSEDSFHVNNDINTDQIALETARELFAKTNFEFDNHKVLDESIDQRFDRLKWEFAELKKDMDIQDHRYNEIVEMQESLMQMRGSKRTGKSDIQSIGTKLTSFRVNQALTLSDIKHINEMESRISKLERLIGIEELEPMQRMQNLIHDAGSLVDAINVIETQYKVILDPQVFEEAVERIKAKTIELENILLLKRKLKLENIEETSDAEKISFIYNQFQKVEGISQMLPSLVQRLKTLDSLHRDAMLFRDTLESIKEEQQILKTLAADTQIGITNLRNSILESKIDFEENVKFLKTKLGITN